MKAIIGIYAFGLLMAAAFSPMWVDEFRQGAALTVLWPIFAVRALVRGFKEVWRS